MDSRTLFERLLTVLGEAMLDDGRWPAAARLIEAACGTRGSMLVFGQRHPDDSVQVFLG